MKMIDTELTKLTDWYKDRNVNVEFRVDAIPGTLIIYMWEIDNPNDKTSMELGINEFNKIEENPNKFYELLNIMYSNLMIYKNK